MAVWTAVRGAVHRRDSRNLGTTAVSTDARPVQAPDILRMRQEQRWLLLGELVLRVRRLEQRCRPCGPVLRGAHGERLRPWFDGE